MELSERMRFIRKSLNLSQEDFSERLGLQQGSYSGIERGRVKTISQSVLKLLELNHKINSEWILNETGEMFINSAEPDIKRSDHCQNCRDLEAEIRGRDRLIDKMYTQLLEMREEINNLNKQLDHYRKRDTG